MGSHVNEKQALLRWRLPARLVHPIENLGHRRKWRPGRFDNLLALPWRIVDLLDGVRKRLQKLRRVLELAVRIRTHPTGRHTPTTSQPKRLEPFDKSVSPMLLPA